MNARDAPGVVTYPPLIFAAFFAAGYGLDLLFPMSMGFAEARRIAGGALAAAGLALACFAIAGFLRARTHLDVMKPALALVTGGPYRITRNPMYLAAAALYAGVGLIFDKPFVLAALIPCLLVMEFGVIRREERYLEMKFGEDYRRYRARTRRWL